METEEILEDIFGADIISQLTDIKSKENGAKHPREVNIEQLVNDYIKNALVSLMFNDEDDEKVGRIGPAQVKFDIFTHYGRFIVSPDRLSINSQSNFSSIRANVGLYQGKWFYELQLGSRGLMQVGWSTLKCKFNQEIGVGDTDYSFSYDGNRVRKWNVSTDEYGESWLTGDIIGCALDVDDGTIDFYRNGRNMGRAFENIPRGADIAYFPTVSLALKENLQANFGSKPMRYPIDGYAPLQAAPKKQIAEATLLFKWFLKIVEISNMIRETDGQNTYLTDGSMIAEAFLQCLANLVLKYIGPLLNAPYITQHIFVPFMGQLLESNESNPKNSTAKTLICLDFLWTFLEESEIKICLESFVLCLLSTFRQVSLSLEYPEHRKCLILLTSVCQHSQTRRHLLQYLLFDPSRFANFLHVKPLDEEGLVNVFHTSQWETVSMDPSKEVNNQCYSEACEKINTAVSELETLQVELLVNLLDNTDGDDTSPTSRTIFIRKFKRFVQENLISNRTPSPITLCCLYRLLSAFRVLWDTEIGTTPVYIPCRSFYDASIDYSGMDRLGGVLSHLNKTFKNELVHLLGPDHDVIVGMDRVPNTATTFVRATRLVDIPLIIPTLHRLINVDPSEPGGSSMIFERLGFIPNREERTPMRLGPVDPTISLLELLDSIILFYHIAAKKQLAEMITVRNGMPEYLSALADVREQLEFVKEKNDPPSKQIREDLLRAESAFVDKLARQARHITWIRGAVFSEEKRKQLSWLLEVTTQTLVNASKEGNMFSFVPDFYLGALTDLCIGLQYQIYPTEDMRNIPPSRDLFIDAAEFFCEHYLDPRIVQANEKGTLIVALAVFISAPFTLDILENVRPEIRVKMVKNLLRPYNDSAWAKSNWVLLKFWRGNGFAFRYKRSPHLANKVGSILYQNDLITHPLLPMPSIVYQEHVKEVLLSDSQATIMFLNSYLNQLNWAFSEFIGMVQEIHNISLRPERVSIESSQLQICATTFDLTVSLLRSLEMICTVAPCVFNNLSQTSSENLLARLCQLLCQVLNRMTSQNSCFQHVILLEIPELESVHYFPILTAVIGILLALVKDDMSSLKSNSSTELPRITRTLLTEPSFQSSSLNFVLGNTNVKNAKFKNFETFSLTNYKEDVTEEEISTVKDMLAYLDNCRAMIPVSKILSDDDDICTICYAVPIEATFKPCNHQTCRICIERHLLNSRECFFCKVIIEKVLDLSGNILHNFDLEPSTSGT